MTANAIVAHLRRQAGGLIVGQRPTMVSALVVGTAVCVCYMALGPLSRETVFPDAGVSLVWLPAAFGSAAVARSNRHWLPVVIPALMLGELIADLVLFGFPVKGALIFVAANISEQVFIGTALRRLNIVRLNRAIDTVLLFAVVAIAEIGCAAVGAIASVVTFGGDYVQAWAAWYLGSLTAIALAGPFFLTVATPRRVSTNRAVELSVVMAATLGAAVLGFSTQSADGGFNVFVAALAPLLGWLAVRCGITAVAAAASIVAYIAAVAAARSAGPFDGTSPGVDLMVTTQIFVVLGCLTFYAAAIIEGARRVATTAEVVARRNLEYQATHDSLTRVLNRYSLVDQMDKAIATAEARESPKFAVLMCDLDGFKELNDSVGHRVGDQVLIEVAQRLSKSVGPNCAVARLGGDEFLVFCPCVTGESELRDVARRLHNQATRVIEVEGSDYFVSISIGSAIVDLATEAGVVTSADLMRRADLALYAAKERGRNRTEVYAAEMERYLNEQVEIRAELRGALADGRIEAWFQPIINGRTGSVCSAEALARLRRVDGSMIEPDLFIPVAEQSGQIVELGARMRQLALTWLLDQDTADGRMQVCVNVSTRELREPDFAESVLATADRIGVHPNRLVLEITERAMFDTGAGTISGLQRLRDAGVAISIDDFGTGYSSLTALRVVPASEVKIDRSFVAGMMTEPDDWAIVSAIIHIAHDMRRRVVAEGVETTEQAAELSRLKCDFLQGDLFGKAGPREQFQTERVAFNRSIDLSGQTR